MPVPIEPFLANSIVMDIQWGRFGQRFYVIGSFMHFVVPGKGGPDRAARECRWFYRQR